MEVALRLTQLFCQQSATIHWDHSLFFHIAFIPRQYHLCIIPRVGFYLGRPVCSKKPIQYIWYHSLILTVAVFCEYSKWFLPLFVGWDPSEIDFKHGRGKNVFHHVDWPWTVITSPFVWHHEIFESLLAAGEKWVNCWKYTAILSVM